MTGTVTGAERPGQRTEGERNMELGTVIGTGGMRQGQEKNDNRKRDWDRDRDRSKITEDQGQELRAWNKGTSTDIQKG